MESLEKPCSNEEAVKTEVKENFSCEETKEVDVVNVVVKPEVDDGAEKIPPKISEDGDKNLLKLLRKGSQCILTSYNFMNQPPLSQCKISSATTVVIGQVLCPLKLYFVMNAEENRHLVYIPGFPLRLSTLQRRCHELDYNKSNHVNITVKTLAVRGLVFPLWFLVFPNLHSCFYSWIWRHGKLFLFLNCKSIPRFPVKFAVTLLTLRTFMVLGISSLCETLHSDTTTVQFIITGLCQSSSFDIRAGRSIFHDDILKNIRNTYYGVTETKMRTLTFSS